MNLKYKLIATKKKKKYTKKIMFYFELNPKLIVFII